MGDPIPTQMCLIAVVKRVCEDQSYPSAKFNERIVDGARSNDGRPFLSAHYEAISSSKRRDGPRRVRKGEDLTAATRVHWKVWLTFLLLTLFAEKG
jgi:hypothetical protein